MVTLSGSSNFELMPFDVIATGTANAEVPGTLPTLTGRANLDEPPTTPQRGYRLAPRQRSPLGGATADSTMFMIAGTRLMVSAATCKLQGTFKSNVASNPPGDLPTLNSTPPASPKKTRCMSSPSEPATP